MKIALGSAQFGLDYGVNNQNGKIAETEISKILNYAKSVNIDTIDTAQAYGNSEKVIGEQVCDAVFKIITKIAFNEENNVSYLVAKSIKYLNLSKLHGLLFYNYSDFFNNPALLDDIKKEKDKGTIDKYGFSLYYPKELEYLLDNNFDFNIIQIPFSIFDRRFEPYFEALKAKNIEIHVRSVFLQGLVFMNPNSLSNHLKAISPQLTRLLILAQTNNISLTSIALNFAINQKQIEKVVIGIDSLKQLIENVKILEENNIVKSLSSEINELQIEDEKILLPFNWR